MSKLQRVACRRWESNPPMPKPLIRAAYPISSLSAADAIPHHHDVGMADCCFSKKCAIPIHHHDASRASVVNR